MTPPLGASLHGKRRPVGASWITGGAFASVGDDRGSALLGPVDPLGAVPGDGVRDRAGAVVD